MKIFLFPAILLLASPFLFKNTEWPSDVTLVESKANQSVYVSGNLSDGKVIDDLSWASNSSNACFVATQNSKFRGNHVFYATTIPAHSILTISVKPSKKSLDMSLYAYMLGMDEFRMVPDLPRCITCEADFKWDYPHKNQIQGSERKVEFNNPSNRPYNILIGVTAPKGVNTGDFELEIRTKS